MSPDLIRRHSAAAQTMQSGEDRFRGIEAERCASIHKPVPGCDGGRTAPPERVLRDRTAPGSLRDHPQ